LNDETRTGTRIAHHCLAAIVFAIISSPSAFSEETLHPVDLSNNKPVVIGGRVSDGDRIIYSLVGRAGQEMEVRVVSIDRKATITILGPQSERIAGGVGEGSLVTNWKGRLAKTGDYRIVLTSTHGTAIYRLRLSIK
jgi:hypothetical protein